MSEPVLKAIIKLFAFVAKEDTVTAQERDHIHAFLEDHLSQSSMERHIRLFDEFAQEISDKLSAEKETEMITGICASINEEVTQKQKMVVLIELMSVVMADGSISEREDKLSKIICQKFNITGADLDLIKQFAILESEANVKSDQLLIISKEKK